MFVILCVYLFTGEAAIRKINKTDKKIIMDYENLGSESQKLLVTEIERIQEKL
jgi:hypothetical protein